MYPFPVTIAEDLDMPTKNLLFIQESLMHLWTGLG